MNDSLLEYIKLKQYLHDLYQRQGAHAWPIIERAVEDLAEIDQVQTSMQLARSLALKGLKEFDSVTKKEYNT